MNIESYIREQIRLRLEKKGRGARAALAKYLGIRADAVSRLASDTPGVEKRSISAEELVKIAYFFDCSIDALADPKMANGNSAKLINAFKHASPAVQDAVLNAVQALIQLEDSK